MKFAHRQPYYIVHARGITPIIPVMRRVSNLLSFAPNLINFFEPLGIKKPVLRRRRRRSAI